MRRERASTEPGRHHAPIDDAGSASLEFLVLGILLLVPIVYLIVSLGTIQEQWLGVETAARQLARTIASAPDSAAAEERAVRVVDGIVAEYGLDRESLDVAVACEPPAARCPEAGAVLSVAVTARVPLPLVPEAFGLDAAARVPVEAIAVHKVSRLWGSVP